MFFGRKREKTFDQGRGIPHDLNAKARIMAYARAWSARNKRPRQHWGPITRAYMEVLWAILYRCHNSKSGLCFPSKRRVSILAKCSIDTVNEAIKVLESAGIMTWSHGIRRLDFDYWDSFGQKLRGTKVLRTSNRYMFFDHIGAKPMVTENPAQKPVKIISNGIFTTTEREIDPNSELERSLARLKAKITAREASFGMV